MPRNAKNIVLQNAKKNKSDEFYTQLSDIESELQYYKDHFKNKVVFCNCDDPRTSNFYYYFACNFKELGLKKLIAACYRKQERELFHIKDDENGFFYEYTGYKKEKIKPNSSDIIYFKGNGDFRSSESINLLKQSDIVVTNPPFSLFREYVDQLVKHDKKFLIIGNINAITYKEIFQLIKRNKAWLGINLGRGISGFIVPEHYELYGTETRIDELGNRIISPNNCLWLTNLDNSKRHEDINLTKKYYGNESYYPFYDNYDAINVNKTQDIPLDYSGTMGVPITFLHKFNPEQFEIIKFRKGNDEKDLSINGKCPYFRILIKNKRIQNIAKTPLKTAGQNIVINTGNFLKEASKVGAELSTEVAALLGTSRVVNFIFGEGSPDMTPNEIAHTIAIVLGMKAFHGIVTIKDKNTIIYENKEIKLEDGFKIGDRVRSKSGKEGTVIEGTQNGWSIVKYDKGGKAFTKNENLTKIKNKNNQGNYMTQSNNKKTSEELGSENKILREKKNDLNNQKKKLEQELSEYENANKKYGLEKGTQPPKWDKELLDHNLDDMIGWLNKKLEGKTQQEIRDNGQLGEYSYILELFTGYKDSKTERNANKILDKLNVLEHYTEQGSLVKIDKSSEIQEKIKEINQEIKDIDTQRAINIVEKKNIYDQQKEVKIWSKKQFETYKESINQASEKVKDLGEGLVGPLSKLKDIENLTREDIKAIQSEIGMTGKEIDGILGPKTLIKLEKYINKQRENLNQEDIKAEPEKVSEEQIKQESKEIEKELKEKSKKQEEKNKSEEKQEEQIKEVEKSLDKEVKNEQQAQEVLDKVEKAANSNINEAQVNNILDKLSSRYQNLSSKLKKTASIINKTNEVINTLVSKLVRNRSVEIKNQFDRGEIKIPSNIKELPPEVQTASLQLNMMQVNLPKFAKVAKFLDGRYIGKEALISALGYIPLIGNITITGSNLIQAGIASYYAGKMGIENSFHMRNLRRHVIDTGISNIPIVGILGDMAYKANNKNLNDMISQYKKTIHKLENQGVDQAFIDHHISIYEQGSGKNYERNTK